ncbi:hypothetical protein BA195_02520 [Tenacibaculum soleae]|uniref:Glycine zipper domain-containing protein n=1 Tax=Tenacibaculum soleae TaxID=447689 RepID=A0A1B9Y1A1_9FLAO|nr:glycine zipper family protein [Tenacibaculum soleae]OCK43595.1 hypothetical protein BA195_02520 [Tenacibaculum soleae]
MKTFKSAIILFIVTLFLANCQNDEFVNNQKVEKTINYDDYLADIQVINGITNQTIYNFIYQKKQLNKGHEPSNQNTVFNTIFQSIEDGNLQVLNDLELSSYNEFTSFNHKEVGLLTIDDINLPAEAVSYFKELYKFQRNDDFNGIFSLLDQFKKEKENPNLLSLIGVFNVIESNKDAFFYQNRGDRSCNGNIKSLIKSTIKGAAIGAITGGLLGSWLGPVGTLAGVVGGAIKGAVYGGLAEVAYQAIECAIKESSLEEAPQDLIIEIDEKIKSLPSDITFDIIFNYNELIP